MPWIYVPNPYYDYENNSDYPYIWLSAAQTILGNFPNISKTGADSPFTLNAYSNGNPQPIQYTSSNNSVATISGNIVTIVGAGVTTITAYQEHHNNGGFYRGGHWTSASITATLTVTKANPTYTSFVIPTLQVNRTVPYPIPQPISNSDGAFSYFSSSSRIRVSGLPPWQQIFAFSVGSAWITATQAETSKFNRGTITTTFSVISSAVSDQYPEPTITNFDEINKTFRDSPFALIDPSSNSPAPFTYTSTDESIATINGNTVTIVGAGSVSIIATQEATEETIREPFSSGFIITILTVSKADTVLNNFNDIYKNFGDSSFELVPPNSNREGVFSYYSSNIDVATISENIVTINGFGETTITAIQNETNNYNEGIITAILSVSKTDIKLLVNNGFKADQLNRAGYTLKELLLNTKFTQIQLKKAGYNFNHRIVTKEP